MHSRRGWIGGRREFFPIFTLSPWRRDLSLLLRMAKKLTTQWNLAGIEQLIHELASIRMELVEAEAKATALLRGVDSTQLKSARNLVHYLALRRTDLRPVQARL